MPWLIQQATIVSRTELSWDDWVKEYDPQKELLQIADEMTYLPERRAWEDLIASVPLVEIQDRLRQAEVLHRERNKDHPYGCPRAPLKTWTTETPDKLVLIAEWDDVREELDIHIRDQTGWLTILLRAYYCFHAGISRTLLDGIPGRYKCIYHIDSTLVHGDITRVGELLTIHLCKEKYPTSEKSVDTVLMNLRDQSLVFISGHPGLSDAVFADQGERYISCSHNLLTKLRTKRQPPSKVTVDVWEKEWLYTVDIIEDCL